MSTVCEVWSGQRKGEAKEASQASLSLSLFLGRSTAWAHAVRDKNRVRNNIHPRTKGEREEGRKGQKEQVHRPCSAVRSTGGKKSGLRRREGVVKGRVKLTDSCYVADSESLDDQKKINILSEIGH